MAKIIACDDEPYIVQGLRYLLESEGYDVSIANNGIEALELIEKEVPDMLIVDVMMPKMSGFQVVQTLRCRPETKSLIIMMLTAKGQRSDAVYAREIGATDFMTKPFSPIKLRERVRSLLAEKCEAPA
jgi:two-component system alkaline phosphatase synthesis response regulator PhoP